MGVKVTNNAFGTISAGINSSATTVTLDSGQGARFPTLGGSDHFYGTLIDTSNNVEIIKVTARSTDSMTVVRAQDNTTARAFSIGDRFELRPVAKLFEDILSEAVPAADTIVNSMIATDAVNADSIAANAVGASELNVSGNGTSGQVLTSDADGTFSWADASSGAISSWKLLYNSNTQVSFNQGGTQLGSLDFYYPVNARIGGSFTKQYDASTSYIVTGGHYYAHATSNLHSHWMWINGDESNAIHLGDDIYALSGEDGGSARQKSKITIQSCFTGKAAGTYTIYTASGTGDTRTHTGTLNANPGSTDGDMSNHNTRSMFWAMEVLYT